MIHFSSFPKKVIHKIARICRSIQALWRWSPEALSNGWRKAVSVEGLWGLASGSQGSEQCGVNTFIKALLLGWGKIPTCRSVIKNVTLFYEISYFSHILRSCGLCYYEGNNIVSLIWQGLQPIFLSEWHLRNSVMQATRLPFCCNVAVYKKLFFPHQSNVNSGSCRSPGAFWCENVFLPEKRKNGGKNWGF